MAEQDQANILKSAFPAPPPFYKFFTADNLALAKELAEAEEKLDGEPQAASQSSATPEQRLAPNRTDLPPELRFLTPPAPPMTGTYRNFGDIYNIEEVLPKLEDQGIQQLYPSAPDSVPNDTESGWTLDRAFYLRKISRSLILNFMELVGVLSINPAQFEEKVADLRTLFINAHHLLNEYRPHQARETLIAMLEEQLEQSRAETQEIYRMKEKVEVILAKLGEVNGLDQKLNEGLGIHSAANRDRVADDQVWEALERELG